MNMTSAVNSPVPFADEKRSYCHRQRLASSNIIDVR